MKKSQAIKLLEKVLSKQEALEYAASRTVYGIDDYGLNEMSLSDLCLLSKELQANKSIIASNPIWKNAMKKIAISAEKKLIAKIKDYAHDHAVTLKAKTDQLKANIAQTNLLQTAAKKLNKKELAQLRKLLPQPNND